MNKQHLRPCIGGWLLIAGGALPAMKSIFTVLYRIIFWGMPIRYITTILGYNFLPDIVYGLPLIALGIVLVMKKQGIPMASAEVTMIPQTYVELKDEQDLKMMNRILDLLDEDDDVQAVYHNWDE